MRTLRRVLVVLVVLAAEELVLELTQTMVRLEPRILVAVAAVDTTTPPAVLVVLVALALLYFVTLQARAHSQLVLV